ncbi:MAG: hypothetical protein AAGA87_09230 [Pseudomonadota bacterium]
MREVSPHEHGTVRVFAINLPEPDATRFAETRLGAALGVDLDPSYVDVVTLADLDEVGLSGLLIDGHGIDEQTLFPDKTKLDALDGVAVVMTSKAIRTRPAHLSESTELTLIGAYPVARAEPSIGGFQKAEVPEKAVPSAPDQRPPSAPVKRPWLIVGAALAIAVLIVIMALR